MLTPELQLINMMPAAPPLGSTGDTVYAGVVEYQDAVATDTVITPDQQKRLVEQIQAGSEPAAGQLLAEERGLVAVLAYHYRPPKTTGVELMELGSKALLGAVRTFVEEDGRSFEDHAIPVIETTFRRETHSNVIPFTALEDIAPQQAVQSYAVELKGAVERRRANVIALAGFTVLQRRVLPLLSFANQQIAEHLDTSPANVKDAIVRARKRIEPKPTNRRALAVDLHRRGTKFALPTLEKPLVELLSNEMLEIGQLLHLDYKDIAAALGYDDVNDVHQKVNFMQSKLHVYSPAGVALMVAIHDTGERRLPPGSYPQRQALLDRLGAVSLEDDEIAELLQAANDAQRELITGYYLARGERSWSVQGEEVGLLGSVAFRKAERGIAAIRRVYAGKMLIEASEGMQGNKEV